MGGGGGGGGGGATLAILEYWENTKLMISTIFQRGLRAADLIKMLSEEGICVCRKCRGSRTSLARSGTNEIWGQSKLFVVVVSFFICEGGRGGFFFCV